MNRYKFERLISNLWLKYRMVSFVCLTQLLISIYGIHVFKSSTVKRETVLMPMYLEESVTISGDTISNSYYEGYARTIMYLALNYNPESVTGNFNRLLPLFHPDKYAEEKKKFAKLAEDIRSTKTSSVFYPQKYKAGIDKETGYIEITGVHQERTESTTVLNAQETYRLEITRNGTHLQLLSIKKLDKS